MWGEVHQLQMKVSRFTTKCSIVVLYFRLLVIISPTSTARIAQKPPMRSPKLSTDWRRLSASRSSPACQRGSASRLFVFLLLSIQRSVTEPGGTTMLRFSNFDLLRLSCFNFISLLIKKFLFHLLLQIIRLKPPRHNTCSSWSNLPFTNSCCPAILVKSSALFLLL